MSKSFEDLLNSYSDVELVPENPTITVPVPDTDMNFQKQLNKLKEDQDKFNKTLEDINKSIETILLEHPSWIYTDGVIYDEDGVVQFITNAQ